MTALQLAERVTRNVQILAAAQAAAAKKWERVRSFERIMRGTFSCASCRTAGCCKQLALCTLFEAVIITERLVRENPDALRALLVQGEAQWALADEAGCIERPEEYGARISAPWFNRNEFCALHNGAGCLIYSDRPMVCASYFVQTPPSECDPPSEKGVLAADNAALLVGVMILDFQFADAIGLGGVAAPAPLGMQVANAIKLGQGVLR